MGGELALPRTAILPPFSEIEMPAVVCYTYAPSGRGILFFNYKGAS